jgi:hypothetical protein
MWICLNDGFISAVEDEYRPGFLKVRGRNPQHLKSIFGEDVVVNQIEGTDYCCRVFVTRQQLADILVKRVLDINYGNFKSSVEDDMLHEMYVQIWDCHHNYQLELKRREARRNAGSPKKDHKGNISRGVPSDLKSMK